MMVPAKSTGKSSPTPKPAAPNTSQVKPAAKPEPQVTTPNPALNAVAAADNPMPATSAELKSGAVAVPEVAPRAEPTASKTPPKTLAKKLSRKGDILNALRAGGTLVLTSEGLYRIANPDGSQNRVSKRRAASFVSQGLVKLTKADDAGKHYSYDPAAEKKAEPRPESKPPQGQTGAA